MNKVEEKKLAIEEVAALMKGYTEYVERVKDRPFTPEIREQLRTRSQKIRRTGQFWQPGSQAAFCLELATAWVMKFHATRRRPRPLFRASVVVALRDDPDGAFAAGGSVRLAFVDRGSPTRKSDVGRHERL